MAPPAIESDLELAAGLPDLRPLARLCRHRWSVPALAHLYRLRGAKFITLANRLAVSRESLSRTLADLQTLDLVMRNPGYGHPMRPEYLLAPDGETIGPAAAAVLEAAGEGRWDACGRKWALPGLAALAAGVDRFNDLAGALAGVTPRALSQTLEDLERDGLIRRRVESGRTPRPRYEPTPGGLRIGNAARSLAMTLSPEA